MRNLITLINFELHRFRIAPGTWVFLALASVALTVSTLFLGNMFAKNVAALDVLFVYVPWVLLVFAPALSMGLWADEWRRGTIERLLATPVSYGLVNIAKFVAAWKQVTVMLLLTAPLVLTVAYLGAPDWGVMAAGYLGAWLLSGVFVAVGVFASLLSRTQAGGFSLAVVILFALLSSGWGVFLNMADGILPAEISRVLLQFSLLDRYSHFSAGLIDLRDVAFFVSLMAAFMLLAQMALCIKRGVVKQVGVLVPALFVAVGANVVLMPVSVRFDATEDKLYTLSAVATQLIQTLEKPVEVTFYYDKDQRVIPPKVQRFAFQVREYLAEIQKLNPGMVSMRTVHPDADLETELDALRKGLIEVPTMDDGYYMGIGFSMGGRTFVLPTLDPVRAGFLEFDVMSAFAQLQRTKRDKILIMTDMSLGLKDSARPQFMNELLATYDVDVQREITPELAKDTDLVIVFLTPFMGPETTYGLDQYIVNGGKALIFIDPYLRTAPSQDYQVPDRNADDLAMDHPADLLRKWGVEYDYRRVAGDVSRALPITIKNLGATAYPMWMYFDRHNINGNLPFTRHLNEMYMIESGFFTPEKVAQGLVYTPVLFTSDNGQSVARSLYDTTDAQALAGAIGGEANKKDVAMMLKGTFSSAYEQMPRDVLDFYDYKAGEQEAKGLTADPIPEHIAKGEKQGAVIAVADMDFMTDSFALTETRTADGKTVRKPANDNLPFVYNAIQYLLGDTNLMALRSKRETHRPLARIEQRLTQAALHFQKEEQVLTQALFESKTRLDDIERRMKRGQSGSEFLIDERDAAREDVIIANQKLRALRRTFRSEMTTFTQNLAVFNLLASPLVLLLVGGISFWRRSRKTKRKDA